MDGGRGEGRSRGPDPLETLIHRLVSASLLLALAYVLLALGALLLVLTETVELGGVRTRPRGAGRVPLDRAVLAGALLLGGGASALRLLRESSLALRELPGAVREDLRRLAGRASAWLRREAARTSRLHWVVLAAVLAGGAAARLLLLGQPIRYDEAVTFLEYASHSLPIALAKYDLPNNHVLHSVLVRISTALFGDGEWAIRLPAFLAGSLVLPATYLVARRLFGRWPALLATAGVAASPVLVLFSTNARGYSLLLLFFLILAALGAHLLRDRSPGGWLLFVVVGALGLHTIPVMLYPLGAVAAWLVVAGTVTPETRSPRRLAAEALAAAAGTAALAALLYLPATATSGVDAVVANRFVTPAGLEEFLASLPGFVAAVAGEWTHGVPSAVTAVAAAGVLIGLAAPGSLRRPGPLLALATLAWCALLLLASRKALYARVWLPALPAMLMLAAAGVVRTAQWGPARLRAPLICAVAGTALTVVGWRAVTGAVVDWDLTGTFREAGRVASFLGPRLGPGDVVVTRTPTGAPLLYEFRRRGIPLGHLGNPGPSARDVYVVVDRDAGQEPGRVLPTRHPVWRTRGRPRRVARLGGAVLYLVPPRGGDAR